jgi:hypothetical protein
MPNPLRAVWGYLRGDDLKAAAARAAAAHAAYAAQAALPAAQAPDTPVTPSARVPARWERVL